MSLLHQLMAAERQRELQRVGRELRRGRPDPVGRRGRRRRARGPGAAGARAGEAAGEPLLAGAAPPRC